jgi:hydrogenase expression/formation protein HypE
MSEELPDIGKISPEIFQELIYPRLGAKNKNILVGPQNGVDVGVVEVGNKVAAITCDPVFIVPEYGWQRSAWFAINILASDAACSGLKPTFMAIDLNLPMEITKNELELMWDAMHKECANLGMSIISGHTARYEGCHYPMVGGATVISIGDKDKYVTPAMAKIGDHIIVTKGPAIEATGIFATAFPQILEKEFGGGFLKKAQDIFWEMSVVKDALTAVKAGVRNEGVTAMHDATECGIWGGLYEIAQASGVGMRIEKEKIVTKEEAIKICKYLEIDPYASISEGTLLLTCRPNKSKDVINLLKKEGIDSSIAGKVVNKKEGIKVVEGGKEKDLVHPRIDPFWGAFYKALKEKGNP